MQIQKEEVRIFMSDIAIVTDSTAYIPQDLREQYDITMVPLNVIFGETVFKEEDLTTETFYEKMRQADELPTTSQPSIGLFEETFHQLGQEHDEIIVITLSSGISGTYQTAVAAGNMTDNVNVHVFDSEVSCMVQGLFVLAAAKMVRKGLESQAILAQLESMKKKSRAYFMADDLSHLHRGGRLNGAQLVVGSLLQIKPVLHFDNKVIVPYEKVRTAKKALAKIFSLLDNDAKDGAALDIVVIHANRPEKAEEIAAELKGKYPATNVHFSYFGPVIGTHLGEGSIGIGWVETQV
ncbi:DegV family protein [Salipaludibacillus agaradhaerens]|uniref:DegV family protein n=1 Tax=Salipaludibacillus agaradhaerens TaxID=76935 RepID=UPI00215165C4|nr:DegV family protein [Salipaludibacillus agaradhaerens]MCR6108040.1 DegV family protein [Salipaludibacillus agaradhaerens]MCR6120066.1 DegV family protein [Salipaludibacillus agaradhaerens]UJW59117.1 DegV family protein [Bacillus sp. A116_S68]